MLIPGCRLCVLPDNHGIDQPHARAAVDLLLERLALVEKFRAQDARLYAYVQDVLFEPQFGGDIRGAVADNLAPCVRQFAFGDFLGDVNTVDVTVSRLRKKLERDPSNPEYLITKRGVGYYIQ